MKQHNLGWVSALLSILFLISFSREVKADEVSFNFEAGAEGWGRSTDTDNQAIIRVSQSSDRAKQGIYSLKLEVDLGDGGKSKGAASVMVTEDLRNQAITAWVWCPPGSSGDLSRPNGIQLFVKDSKWRSEYGPWRNIGTNLPMGTWAQVTMTPSNPKGQNAHMTPGFDPTDIIVIGIKVARGDGSTVTYTGDFYLDEVYLNANPRPVPPADCKFDFEFGAMTLEEARELQATKPFDQHRPYWGTDPAWNAEAWSSEDITIEEIDGDKVLAISASFTPTSDATRKGYVVGQFLPRIDIQNKDNWKIRAKIKFDSYLGPFDMVASWFCYDERDTIREYGVKTKWYTSIDKPVGGSGWNEVVFDLSDPSYFHTDSLPYDKIGRASLKNILQVGIQFWANVAYTGTIYIDNVTIAGEEDLSTFQPKNEGFVERNGTRFELNGEYYYFAGNNVYYLFHKPHYMIDNVMEMMERNNLKVLRTWGFCDGLAPYAEDNTPNIGDGNEGCTFQPRLGEYDRWTFENFDYVLKKAAEYGIRAIVPLVNYWSDYGGMSQYVEWLGKAEYGPGGEVTNKHIFYTDPEIKAAYRNYISYVLNRPNALTGIAYKDDPTIFAFELANEPENENDPSGDVVYEWAREMSEYIKSIDPNHMVAIGDSGFMGSSITQPPVDNWPYNGYKGVDWERNLQIESIDFGTVHVYPDHWGRDIPWTIEWIGIHTAKAHNIGRPVVFEEFGRKIEKGDRDEVFAAWTDLIYTQGANGSNVWMIAGKQIDETYYPDYDGFTFWESSVNTISIIKNHATLMNEKGKSIDMIPPAAVTDLSVTTSSSIELQWTAPGDDVNVGAASAYIVKYNTEEITESNWDESTGVDGEPAPSPSGSTESMTVTMPYPGAIYYFAIKTQDEVPNTSDISNSPSGRDLTTYLYTGWNLVAFVDSVISIDEFLLSVPQCDSVWRYDASTSNWLRHIVDGPSFLNNLDEVGAGFGYWVRVTEDCTLNIAGNGVPAPSNLAIRKPPFILYGKLIGIAPSSDNTNVSLKVGSVHVGSYTLGSDPAYMDYYVLEIAVDDSFSEGDVAEIYVDGALVKENPTNLGGIGVLRRLDILHIPKATEVFQNYPNPFNPDTWVPYQLSEDSDIIIRIYNVSGGLVRTLDLGHKSAGFYISKHAAAYWNGKNAVGEHVSSGIYFYTIQSGNYTATKKMTISK